MNIKNRMIRPAILITGILLLFIVILPVFSPYLPGTADGFAHKFRLVNFHQALSEGIIRPRWTGKTALGYGSPLFLFNYSIPYYLVDALYRTGISIREASQLYAAGTILGSAAAMYLAISLLWGTWAGVVAALVYAFAPYHLLTVYSYEAWGEMLAFLYPPLILYGLYQALRPGASRRWWIFAAASWILFILSHNISSYISSPFIFLAAYYAHRPTHNTLRRLIALIVYAGAISMFFVLPAVSSTGLIHITDLWTKELSIRTVFMFPLLSQLQTSLSVISGTPVVYKAFSVGIPIALIAVAVSGIALTGFARRRRPAGIHPVALLSLVFCIVSLILVDPVSSPLYEFRPLQYVLYPYRFLFVATLTGSILAGYLVRSSFRIGILVVILAVVFGYPYAHPQLDQFQFPQSFFSQPQPVDYATPTLKSMGTVEFLPQTASITFVRNQEILYHKTGRLPDTFIIPKRLGTANNLQVHQESVTATLTTSAATPVTVSTFYYPNWRAAVDGARTDITHDAEGRIVLFIPEGTHRVSLWFGYTNTELAGIAISIAGILLFAGELMGLHRIGSLRTS